MIHLRMLFFVALLVGVAVSDDTTMSQPYVQAPRVFTSIQLNSEGVQRRDLEDIDDGAGAGLVEVDKVQSDIFDHVGQKFVRKALDVLDQRLLKAAEAKRKGVDDDDDDGDDGDDDEDVEDDAVEEEGHKDNMVLEGLHVDNDDNDENLKNDQHHDFERIEEPSLKRRRKQKRSNKEDADLMNALIKYPESDSDMNKAIQPPLRRQNSMKGNKLGSSKQRHHQFEDEADKDELLSNAGAHKKRPAMTAQPMVPVDLNVNEGVEGGDVIVPKMDDNGLLDLASAYEETEENSNFQTPHLGMVGSAAAGVGLIGSAAYCCISRRRSRKHHSSRSELPMYEPDSPPSNTASSTPDGYRVRRGLTKYR